MQVLGFYDADMKRVGEVQVGAFPHEAALSPDKKLLYVSVNGVLWMTEDAQGANQIAIVDVESMKKVGEIDLGRFHRPHGIAFDAQRGSLLATTERPFGLVQVDVKSGKVVRDFDVKGKSPHMVMLSKDGRWAWVSNTDSNSVAVVDLNAGTSSVVATGGKPQGGVFSGDTLFLTNSEAGQIAIIDTKSSKQVGSIEVGKLPGRIALTPDGSTLVYNLERGVGFADVATRKQTGTIEFGKGRPLSLTMTRDGKLAFAGVQDDDQVYAIDVPRRKVLRVVDLPKGSGPDPVIPIE